MLIHAHRIQKKHMASAPCVAHFLLALLQTFESFAFLHTRLRCASLPQPINLLFCCLDQEVACEQMHLCAGSVPLAKMLHPWSASNWPDGPKSRGDAEHPLSRPRKKRTALVPDFTKFSHEQRALTKRSSTSRLKLRRKRRSQRTATIYTHSK